MTYTATEQTNLEVIRKLYLVENAHDADAYGAHFAPDVEVWGNGKLIRNGRAAQAEHIRNDTFKTFPDWHNETLALFADGDVVIARWRCTGTFAEPGHHAEGHRLELTGTSTFALQSRMIHHFWYDMDTAAATRLFLAPAPTS